MGRKIYDEDLRLNLILNGQGLNQGSKQMVAELGKMEMKMIRLEQESKKLASEIKLLAKDEAGNAGKLVTLRKAYADTTQEIRAQAVAIEKLRQKVGLAGMTVQQLKNHAKALQVQLNNMTGNPVLRQKLLNDLTATNSRIRTLTTGAGRLAQAWERLERTATRAGSILGMFTMVIYGIVRVVTGVITRMKELEDLMGTVRKNTGLAVGEVWEMKDAFDAWDTRTKTDDLLKLAIVAGKLGIEGKDAIMEFVESANMIQIALGDDLDGSVEDTVNSLGKLMNAFRVDKEMPINEAMLRTGGVLNQLAKSSAASAGTILNYMTRLSSVGELAGFTIAQIGGLGSALDAMNVPSERGATAVQKIMLQLANPKKISDFAEALGLTAEGYKKMLKEDPNNAMIALLGKFVATKSGLVELTGGMKDFGAKGQYMTAVIGSLAQNLDVLVAQQKIAETEWKNKIAGASVLDEYIIMNNNFTANVLKQQKIIRATTDAMNKDAEPAVLRLVEAWTLLVVGAKTVTDWIGRQWTAIKILTMAYILYKAPAIWRISNLILEDLWLRKTYASEAIKVFWMKVSVIWQRNLATATGATAVAQRAMLVQSNFLRIANIAYTQGLRAAIVEMRLLRNATVAMAFPLVAAAAVVAVLAAAFYVLVIRRKALSEEEKRHITLHKTIQADYLKEKGSLDLMIDRLKDVNISQGERSKIMKSLQEQYGDYLPMLMKEGITAAQMVESYDKIVEAMGKKAIFENATKAGDINRQAWNANELEIKRMEALMKKHQAATEEAAKLGVTRNVQLDADLKEEYSKKIESLKKLRFAYTDEYAKLKSDIAGSAAPKAIKITPVGMESKDEDLDTFKKRQKDIASAFAQEELDITKRAIATNAKKEATDDKIRQAKIRFLKASIEDKRTSWRTEEGEAAAYVAQQQELADLQYESQLEKKKTEKKDDKTAEEKNDALNKSEIAKINKRRLDNITSEDQYNAELLQQEFDYLQAKLLIYDKGSEKYEEAEAAILIKQVTAQQKVKDLILQAQKELSDAQIENLEDGISKEKAIEEKRWADELAGLKKRLNDKKILNDDEKALNDDINAIILQKKAAFDKRIADLDAAAEIQKQMNIGMSAQGTKERFAVERQLAQLEYTQELKRSKGNAAKIAEAERKLSNKLINIKKDELEARIGIYGEMAGAASNLFGALAEIAGKETALGRALFLFQQAAAIGQIVINTMIANAQAKVAALGVPLVWGPMVAMNNISMAASIASVLAQTIGTFSAKQKAKGSYPVIGADDGRLYHASEGGNPQTGVYNSPTLLNMSDGRSLVGERAPELVVDGDTFRRIQLNAPEILRDIYAYAGKGPGRSKQKASGSYPDEGLLRYARNDWANGRRGEGAISELMSVIGELNNQLKSGIRATATINKYGRNGIADSMNEIAKFNKKVYRK